MKQISQIRTEDKRGGINVNSAHNEQINNVMMLMGENPHNSTRYAYWCGRTKHIKTGIIYQMVKDALERGNPPAKLFNYLLKISK